MSAKNEVYLGIDIGVRNLSYCEFELQEGRITITKWGLVDILEGVEMFKSTRDICTSDIHPLMQLVMPQLFPESYARKRVHHVCIEAQPLGKYANGKTVLVSHLIYNYFRQFLHTMKCGDCIQSVQFVNPARKYCKTWLIEYGKSKQKTHSNRKLLSVELCQLLMNDFLVTNNTGILLENCEKNDDLADAFLLGLSVAQSILPSFN
jgi:hypothetical protein